MTLSEQQMTTIRSALTEEMGLAFFQVENTLSLLLEGATVPFIARYRKERTGGLDEVGIRRIEERFRYLSELEGRRQAILESIEEQGGLSSELRRRIAGCRQKTELEDLYLPFKPKRRTKATIARERGLEPLADLIAGQNAGRGRIEEVAVPFVASEKNIPDAAAALAGAGHILAERLSENPAARALVRRQTWEKGRFVARPAANHASRASKFEMYYDYSEPLRQIPSHRILAMRRGEKEGVLRLGIEAPEEEIIRGLRKHLIRGPGIFQSLLENIAEDAYRRLLAPSIESELRAETKKAADEAAIAVFAENLRHLLLAPPAGECSVLAVDPGLRTGSKLAALDSSGRLLEYRTIYPHVGSEPKTREAREVFRALVARHGPTIVAIGNGTASREMEQFCRGVLKEAEMKLPIAIVSEAGASVYSASDIAREEFPDLDVSVRGAVSIGRRLQDPLAELVKIEPKSIGVGQYQHDVSQSDLQEALDAVVESCVNFVGVDLNTASWRLLSYVSGIGENLARAIVRYRDQHGRFHARRQLLEVPRFGPKAFEQSAGFLRIREGENPLDNTGVHPERYELVRRMAQELGVGLVELVGRSDLTEEIHLSRYAGDEVGLPTLRDIITELQKPGRDPRSRFETAALREDVTELSDLKVDMVLEGTVTNVTAFGAFVDVGVHQDGLVHISHLARRFVKDPADVVRVGQVVRVRVLAADPVRKRISLSIKEAESGQQRDGRKTRS